MNIPLYFRWSWWLIASSKFNFFYFLNKSVILQERRERDRIKFLNIFCRLYDCYNMNTNDCGFQDHLGSLIISYSPFHGIIFNQPPRHCKVYLGTSRSLDSFIRLEKSKRRIRILNSEGAVVQTMVALGSCGVHQVLYVWIIYHIHQPVSDISHHCASGSGTGKDFI